MAVTSAQPGLRKLCYFCALIQNCGDVDVRPVQAAHAVIQLQETGKPVYKVKNVSLNALCELYDAPINPMKEQVF
jgi:hypothetical protein